MGNLCETLNPSEQEQRVRNKQIDEQIQKEKKRAAQEVKMLLLGAGESGKSTIAKQMKIIHMRGFASEERQALKPVIYYNILSAMQTLIKQAQKFQIDISSENTKLAEEILSIKDSIDSLKFTDELANKIKAMWRDRGILDTVARANEFQFYDSAPYFFESIDRVVLEDYTPTDMDLLRVRAKTTGILELQFLISNTIFRLVDVGGQRNERRKWIHCFQDVTAILFCVALSEYDLVLEEDGSVNRMHESLNLFDETINSQWFENTSIILFLNKKDLFAEKIKRVDPKCCFPNYDGGLNYDNGVDYIKKKFTARNKVTKRSIYVHITCATDTENMRFVFSAVKDIFLSNTLNNAGFISS